MPLSPGLPAATTWPASNTLRTLSILALLGLVVAYLHAELYTVYGPFMKLRDWGPAPAWALFVQQIRWWVRGMATMSLLALVVLETRWRVVSDILHMVVSHRLGIGVILTGLGLLSGIYFLLPGYVTAASDGIYYTTLAWLVKDALTHAQLPMWTNWGDMGFPLMQFYSPLFFTVVALVNAVIPNIWIGIKLAFLTLHVLSVCVIYIYVQNLTGSKYGGLAAAFAFGFAYYRYHVIVYVNKFPMVPTFLLWPLQLYLVDRVLVHAGRRRTGIGLAFVSAIALMAHAFIGGYSAIFSAVYGVIRVLTLGDALPSSGEKLQAVKRLAFWLSMGVLSSLYFTLPPLREVKLTVIPGWYPEGYVSPGDPLYGTPWAATFTFAGSQGTGWVYGYIGISIMTLALIGGAVALIRRKWQLLAPLALLGMSLFSALGPFSFFLTSQGQYLVFVVVIGAAGVGMLVSEIEDGLLESRFKTLRLWRELHLRKAGILALVCGLVAVDMLRYQLFVNYLVPPTPNGSPNGRVAAHQWLAKHSDEIVGRVLDPSQPENGWQIPMVAGLAGYENNGHSSIYSAVFMRNLRPTNPNPHGIRPYSLEELLGPARDLLLIADTGLVIADSPTPLAQYPGAVETDDGAVLIPTGGGMPLLASQQTTTVEPQLQFAPLAREMSIDRESGVAAFIPILAGEGPRGNSALSGSALTARVGEHLMESQYVRMDYELSSPAYLQLSYSYYPYLRVTLDGAEVETFPTAFGLIGLQSLAGSHTLEIVPYLSPFRRVVLVFNLAALLLLAALWLLSFRRPPARRTVVDSRSKVSISRRR